MLQISEPLFMAVCALPALGLILGALWMRQRNRLPRVSEPPRATPVPVMSPGVETQLFDALDAVQHQLAELADRQDFTERLMTRDRSKPRTHGDTPIPTPV